jgi:maleylacetate reductase
MEFDHRPLPGHVRFAAGAARRNLAEEIAELGLSRLLLIAGEAEADLAAEVSRDVAGSVVATFRNVRPHVPAGIAAEAREMATAHAVDGLVTVGGGSTTGTGKAVALTTGIPLVCVPTTYAGSEMTPVWGMTTASRKETGRDSRVLPRGVIYDADLTRTLPARIAVFSALNAMAHCVEAFWAPGANPVTSLLAEAGIRALSGGLRAADGAKRRDHLLYGSYLAGSAFAVAGSGLHHKICHALGGAYDLPHAETHTVLLPHVLAFNAGAVPDAERAIARALDADDAVAGLGALYREVGALRSLSELGLRRDQLARTVGIVSERLPIANPRPVAEADIVAILAAALG